MVNSYELAEMTEVGYRNLLFELGSEMNNDPDIEHEINRLKFICGNKIPEERRREITDVFTWFKELEKSGNLGIDNLELLKEVLVVLKKHSCLEKVVAFEADRQRATLAVQLPRIYVEGSRQAVPIAVGEVVMEQRDGGMNLNLKLALKFISCNIRRFWGSFVATRTLI